MKIGKVIYLIISILFIYSIFTLCSSDHKKSNRSGNIFNFKEEINKKYKPTSNNLEFLHILKDEKHLKIKDIEEAIQIVKWVKLETNPNCFIGNIDQICILEDRIIVLDKNFAKSVTVFDFNGKFIGKYNKRGKGPGEFVRIDYIAVAKDSIFILINGGQIYKFDHNLASYEGINLDCYASEFIVDTTNNGYVITGDTQEGDVTYCNNKGISDFHFLAHHNSGNYFSPHPFSISKGNVLFYHLLLDSVYLIDHLKCIPVRAVHRNKEIGHITYFENNENIIAQYSQKYVLKIKDTGEEFIINRSSKSPYFNLIYSNFYIFGTFENYYLSKLEPTKLLRMKNMEDSRITDLKRGVNIDSNPIIILTLFKN
jgi:hypothetical protein